MLMGFLKGKNILITGATGLVGINTLIRLKAIPGIKIRATYHLKEPLCFSDNISYVKADLVNFDDCQKMVQGIDYVLIFAAKIVRRPSDLRYLITNLTMNFQMLEAAYQAGVKKFLWLSSATAYPPQDTPLKEEGMFSSDPADECFPLAWATRYTEILCRMYATKLKRKMTAIVLRPTAIYGEYGDFDFSTCHVLPALMRKVIERHNPIEIWGSGEVKRDFIYVGDVVEACILALEKIDGFADFNIGTGQSYSIKEILKMILEVDNYAQAQVVFDRSKQDRHSILIDCKKAKDVIGFAAKTSFRDGIAKTISWYRANQLTAAKSEKVERYNA